MDSMVAPPARPAAVALRQLGSLAVVAAALSGVYLATGLGIPCPFRFLTGWLCPFCGGTTAGAALLTGDVAGAWHANPLLLIVAGIVAVRVLAWVVEWVREPQRPVGRRWVPWPIARHAGSLASLVGVVYVLVRNLT